MSKRYYSGVVAVPATGQATPVCTVGPAGCMIVPDSAVYIGGPDVTPSTGLPVDI